MVATLIAYVGTALMVSPAVATFIVNFALSLIVTRVFADNPEKQQDMGVRQQVPPSAVNAIPIVYGDAYMGGTFVDAVLTVDQRKMYYVLAISSISPNGQFTFDQTDMYFGDRKIGFDPTEQGKVITLTDEASPPNVDDKISGNLFIYLFTSTQAGVITAINSTGTLPNVIMGGSDIAAAQRWPASNRQMNGLAFAIVVLNYNRDAGTTQLSPITFKVKHALNGTGVAKAGDVWYDYMTNDVYGGAVGASFVDAASGTALNVYGDQTITFTNSSGSPSTQARYRINGVLDAGQSVLSNVDRIMSACDSWMTYNAALGQWSVVINKAESASYAFNDNNIIGEIRVSASDLTSSINQVEARFPFKGNRDQANFVNIETPVGLLYPNEPVNKYSITYDMVNDSVQTHYLANRLLEQAREDLIVGFNTTYYGIQVDAGNVVSVTNSDYGWNAKLFRVMKVNEASLPDGSLGARLELSEYNAQVYDDQPITQFAPVPNSGLPSVSYFSPLAAPTVTGFPSATIPYIDVQVYVPATGRVTFGNLFWTSSATPTAADWKLVTSAATVNGQAVINNTYYTFANITLNTGTYYFAYNVGNEVTTSTLSPISAAFVWNPTASAGVNGTRTAILDVYQWSVNAPTVFPVGTSVYTWATGQFTAPATLNGWSLTPPATVLGQNLWIARTIYADTLTTATSTVTWAATAAYSVGGAGTNGTRTAFLEVYQWAASTPTTFPSGTSTYTWATGAFTAPSTANGWLLTPAASIAGYTLYACSVQYADTLTTATSTVSWTTSTAYAIGAAGTNGSAGSAGNSFRIAYYTQSQSLAAPSVSPNPTTGNSSFPSSVAWAGTITAPTGGQSLWAIDGTYVASTNQTTWSTPYLTQGIPTTVQSDNYVLNTSGWQIQRDTGNAFFNNGTFRGNISGGANIEITGSAKFNGAVTTTAGTSAITANVTFAQRYGLIAYADNSPYSPVVQTAAVYGVGSGMAFGIRGESYGTGGVGVVGFGDQHGVEGNSSATSGVGVRGYGYAANGTGVSGVSYGTGPAVYGNSLGGGPAVWCDGIFKWSTYSIAVPTGSSSDVLRGNGTWGAVSFATNATNATNATYADYLGGVIASSWARIFPTNAGIANAGGSGLNILGSGSTGIVGAYVKTFGSSNIVTIEVVTTSPSDIRLKEEIADSDLGLAFVKQLRPVSYKLKADPKHQKGYGFIADEVDQIIESGSSLVYHEADWKVGDETGFKTIHYPSYIAVLTKAIQELTAKVEALEAKLKV
jgi:hypothetical protein